MSQDGAPTLMSSPSPRTDLQLATAATDVRLQAAPADWGLYFNNEKEIKPDSILALDYRREWAVADYPLEQGAFDSYDKVARPFEVHLRMTKGGSEIARRSFLAAVESASASMKLYDIVTPERVYLSVSVTSLGYSRTATNGAGLLTVDIGLREIRENAGAQYTKVKSPDSADPVQGGTVQPQPTAPAVIEKVRKALAPASAAGAPSN